MQKLRKTAALFLALAMVLSMGALAADNEQEEQEFFPRLWTRWVNWDEEGHPFAFENNGWYDGGQNCHPGEARSVVFYVAEKWGENDQPIDPQPVKVADLKVDSGVTLNPYGEIGAEAAEGDPLAECYVEYTVDEFDKEYTVSYGDASLTIDSYLPDISIYSAPERTTENYMINNAFTYAAGHMDDVCYILFETDIERYGRVVESLALSENDEDTMNDLVEFEKVSDEVYAICLKDGAEPFAAEMPRVRITITWKEMDGSTWEDDTYEIWFENRDALLASEEALLDGTTTFPDWDFKKYQAVANKLSNTVTMTAGEEKTVYLSMAYLDYPENGKPEWISAARASVAFDSADTALTVTSDDNDSTKFTLSCDTPGEYTVNCYHWDVRVLDEDGKPMSGDETWEILDEVNELWGDPRWTYAPKLDGSMLFWNLDTDEELECPYETIAVRLDEVNPYVYPLTVVVEDNTPVTEVYSDVAEGQWYVDAVAFVTNKGMMTGSNGKFNPNGNITGAEFVQIMYNIAGRPAPADDAAFEGVSGTEWYANAVLWAAGEGLISDTGDTTLVPTAPLTREQMFVILYNMVGDGEKVTADLSGFTDAGEISAWAADAVNWAVSHSVTSGVGNGKFAPADSTNRAGVAAMLMKYYQSK